MCKPGWQRKAPFLKTPADRPSAFLIVPNLVRGLVPSAPDQIWVADITYVHLARAFAYLAVILDAFSRKAVGWAFEDTRDASLAIAALGTTLDARKPKPGSLIHHSDRGVKNVFTRSSILVLRPGRSLRKEVGSSHHKRSVRKALEKVTSLGRIASFNRPIVQFEQRLNDVSANLLVVLNNKDRFSCSHHGIGSVERNSLRSHRQMGPRQVDLNRSALADFAVDCGKSSRLFCKSIHLTETKAGAVPGFLCRKERLKCPLKCQLVHSSAVVCNAYQHVRSRSDIRMLFGILLIYESIVRFNRQLATVRHCIARVHDKIEECSLHLV